MTLPLRALSHDRMGAVDTRRAVIVFSLATALAVFWTDPFAPALVTQAPTASTAPSGLLEQARALGRDGAHEEALALLTAAIGQARTELPALLLLVDLERHLGDPARAVELGNEAIQRWPESSDSHLGLGHALATRMQTVRPQFMAVRWLGDYKDAVARAIELAPRNRAAWVTRIGFYTYAPALVGGDHDEARRLCDELAGFDPIAAEMMRALVLNVEGETEAGLALARAAARLAPDDQDLAIVQGGLAKDLRRNDEALGAFDRVLAGPRGEPWFRALYQRASVRILKRMDPQAVLDDLDMFLALAPPADYMPTPSYAWYQKGRAYEQLERDDAALAAYEQALALDDENEIARTAAERLR